MQLHDLLVVVVNDAKVMSSTVTEIFAITLVVNNYYIQTELRFLNRTEPKSIRTESEFFSKTEPKPKRNLNNVFRTSLSAIKI